MNMFDKLVEMENVEIALPFGGYGMNFSAMKFDNSKLYIINDSERAIGYCCPFQDLHPVEFGQSHEEFFNFHMPRILKLYNGVGRDCSTARQKIMYLEGANNYSILRYRFDVFKQALRLRLKGINMRQETIQDYIKMRMELLGARYARHILEEGKKSMDEIELEHEGIDTGKRANNGLIDICNKWISRVENYLSLEAKSYEFYYGKDELSDIELNVEFES